MYRPSCDFARPYPGARKSGAGTFEGALQMNDVPTGSADSTNPAVLRLDLSRHSRPIRMSGFRPILLAVTIFVVSSATLRPADAQTDGPAAVESAAIGSSPEIVKNPSVEEPLESRWGIRILGMRLTAGGFMIDFRFLVEDASKAALLFSSSTVPYLLDPETGAEFMIPAPPKVGRLRTTRPPENGRVYWMFFANPGRFIGRGDRVTVVAGEFRAENLPVE